MVADGLPRTRGDGPGCASLTTVSRSASPHTRGWTRLPSGDDVALDGFPAHAGMDPRRARAARRRDGASPHTRGWTPCKERRRTASAGFPAHAGMDLPEYEETRIWLGLPRTRGDGPDWMSRCRW